MTDLQAGPAERLSHIEALLGLFWDDSDSLHWHPANQPGPFWTTGGEPSGPIRFSVDCSDTFWWATADAEPVDLPGDLESLAATRAEFINEDWPLLWVCRKRRLQPMPAYFRRSDPESPFVQALRGAGPLPSPS